MKKNIFRTIRFALTLAIVCIGVASLQAQKLDLSKLEGNSSVTMSKLTGRELQKKLTKSAPDDQELIDQASKVKTYYSFTVNTPEGEALLREVLSPLVNKKDKKVAVLFDLEDEAERLLIVGYKKGGGGFSCLAVMPESHGKLVHGVVIFGDLQREHLDNIDIGKE